MKNVYNKIDNEKNNLSEDLKMLQYFYTLCHGLQILMNCLKDDILRRFFKKLSIDFYSLENSILFSQLARMNSLSLYSFLKK